MLDKFYTIITIVLTLIVGTLFVICLVYKYGKVKKEKFVEMIECRNTEF